MNNKARMTCILQCIKLIFVSLLLAAFLSLFAVPAVKDYLATSVVLNIYTEPENQTIIENIPAPGITICPQSSTSKFPKSVKQIKKHQHFRSRRWGRACHFYFF